MLGKAMEQLVVITDFAKIRFVLWIVNLKVGLVDCQVNAPILIGSEPEFVPEQ